jgi:hypothetical protein
MRIVALLGLLAIACGSPRAPSDEDACRTDDGCAAGLICCHETDDTVSGDRGFCVKRGVCANVSAPPQPPMPVDD